MSNTHSLALGARELTELNALVAAHPGVSMHLGHLAALRLGLRVATADSSLLAEELAAIGDERRQRRLLARSTKRQRTPAATQDALEGGARG